VSRHGTLSLTDNVPRSTWSVQDGDQKRTFDSKIAEAEFRDIWEAQNDLVDLKSYISTDPAQKLDFTENYVIGITFVLSGRRGTRLYLIPHHCKSSEILAWARRIESFGRQGELPQARPDRLEP